MRLITIKIPCDTISALKEVLGDVPDDAIIQNYQFNESFMFITVEHKDFKDTYVPIVEAEATSTGWTVDLEPYMEEPEDGLENVIINEASLTTRKPYDGPWTYTLKNSSKQMATNSTTERFYSHINHIAKLAAGTITPKRGLSLTLADELYSTQMAAQASDLQKWCTYETTEDVTFINQINDLRDAVKSTCGLPPLSWPTSPSDGGTGRKPCDHNWKTYVGLVETYVYCEKCDQKKDNA